MIKWHYDERPQREDDYLCLLTHEDRNTDGEKNGKVFAEVGIRSFGKQNDDSWVMLDEKWTPDTPVWQEQTGSFYGEKVVAWCDIEELRDSVKLPEGAEWWSLEKVLEGQG